MRAAHTRGACARLSRELEKCAPSLYLRGESVARQPSSSEVGFRPRAKYLAPNRSQNRVLPRRTFNISRVFNSVVCTSKLTRETLVSGELKITAHNHKC